MKTLSRIAQKLDYCFYQIEKALILIAVSSMTLLVFFDVIQRTFSRPVGRTTQLLLYFLPKTNDPKTHKIVGYFGEGLFIGVSILFFFLALHTLRKRKAKKKEIKVKPWSGLAYVCIFWLLSFGLIKALLAFFPSGIPGAQKFALGFMMWAAFLGASVATRKKQHILLGALKKKVDPKIAPFFALLAGLTSGFFCFYLAFLGRGQFFVEYDDWKSAPGVGVFESLPIPLWVVTLALPISFALVGARFAVYGIADFAKGKVSEQDEQAHVSPDCNLDGSPLCPKAQSEGARA